MLLTWKLTLQPGKKCEPIRILIKCIADNETYAISLELEYINIVRRMLTYLYANIWISKTET